MEPAGTEKRVVFGAGIDVSNGDGDGIADSDPVACIVGDMRQLMVSDLRVLIEARRKRLRAEQASPDATCP